MESDIAGAGACNASSARTLAFVSGEAFLHHVRTAVVSVLDDIADATSVIPLWISRNDLSFLVGKRRGAAPRGADLAYLLDICLCIGCIFQADAEGHLPLYGLDGLLSFAGSFGAASHRRLFFSREDLADALTDLSAVGGEAALRLRYGSAVRGLEDERERSRSRVTQSRHGAPAAPGG